MLFTQPPLLTNCEDDFEESKSEKQPLLSRDMYDEEDQEQTLGVFAKLMRQQKNVSDQDYVKMFIDYVIDIFNKERGKDETKKANLADIKSTQVDTCSIITQALECDAKNLAVGNVKALIPLQRERLKLEWDQQQKMRYKKGENVPLKEKRIFGILTPY